MKRTRRVESDGITQTVRVAFDVTGPLTRADGAELKAALDRTRHNASFDLSVVTLAPMLDALRAAGDPAAYGSASWYADRLRALLDRIQTERARGWIDNALRSAVAFGAVSGEMAAKGWPDLHLGREYRAAQRARSKAGVRAKQLDASRDRATFSATVAALRTKHPDHSTRAIAALLVGPLDEPERTRAIERKRKQIERLDSAGRRK